MTLIEVVAAIAILGGVLAGIVLAQSRHTRQLGETRLHAQAAQAVDALLTRWWTRDRGIPVGRRGEYVDGERVWAWTTQAVEIPRPEARQRLARAGARVVRVALRPAGDGVARRRAEGNDAPTIAVDLVLPAPDWEPEHVRRQREHLEQLGPPQGVEGGAAP